MPACAVASLTPSIAGMSGTFFGARGETVVLIAMRSMVGLRTMCLKRNGRDKPGHDAYLNRAG
jgi:hypothetical protein